MENVNRLKLNLGVLNELNKQSHCHNKVKFNSIFPNSLLDKENKKELTYINVLHPTNTSFDLNFNKNQNTNSSYNVSAIYGKHEVELLHDVNHQLTSESFNANNQNEKHILSNYNNANINGIANDNNEKDNLNLFNYSFNNNYPSNISSTALGSVEDRKNSITLNYNSTTTITYNNSNSKSNNKGNTVSNTKNKVRKKTPGSIPCEHCGCKLLFTTLKQKLNHHNKMNKNCRNDTIHLLKALTEIKKIILSLNLKHTGNSTPFIPETLINKYNSILSNIPHKEYALLFPGISLMEDVSVETELVEDDDDDDNELC